MKEATEKLLTQLGVDSSVIDALKADALPDDFSIEDSVAAYKSKRKELILNDSVLMKELKQKFNAEQYPAMMKPLLKAVRDAGGFSSEEIDALKEDGEKHPNMKKAIAALAEKLRKNGNASVEEVQQKLFDLKKEFEDSKTSHTEQITNLKNGHAMELKQGKLKTQFSKVINGLDLVIPHEGANIMLYNDINNNYKMDLNESGEMVILNKDGSKVTDDNNFLSALDVIKGKAETYNIIKKSNGGGGDGGNGGNPNPNPNPNRPQGKLTGRAAELEARANKNKR